MLRDGVTPFYFGHVQDGDDIGLIFINVAILEAFIQAEELHMDGTFWCTPQFFQQLATLHTIAFGYVIIFQFSFFFFYLFILFYNSIQAFPTAFFLMTSRTEALYTLCINRVLEVCMNRTGRVPTPLRLISDYELAILRAMQAAFPNGRVRGCFYHSGMVIISSQFFCYSLFY
jgi:hypothetical protein